MTTQTSATATPDAAVAPAKRILEELLSGLRPRFFDVRFWDGSVWAGDSATPRFTLVLRHPGAVRRMFWPPRPLSFASAYVYDDFDIEGDMLHFPPMCALPYPPGARLAAGPPVAARLEDLATAARGPAARRDNRPGSPAGPTAAHATARRSAITTTGPTCSSRGSSIRSCNTPPGFSTRRTRAWKPPSSANST